MKKFNLLVVAAVVSLALASAGHAADQKIGTVNMTNVFEKYYKTIQSDAAIKLEAADMEKEGRQMIASAEQHKTEWQKLIDKANDQAVSSDEREKSKKAAEQKYIELETDKQSITQFNQIATSRLREKQLQRRDDIVKEIRQILNIDAKAAGYTMVIDVSGLSQNSLPVVIYTTGQNDMTDGLIKELNSTAPPGALDVTNTSSSSAPSGAAATSH